MEPVTLLQDSKLVFALLLFLTQELTARHPDVLLSMIVTEELA